MNVKALFTLLILCAAGSAAAAKLPNFIVQGVQMPAWVEHASGARSVLALGMPLAGNDRIITGPGARALLRLADGSLIKLGQNGMLMLEELGQQKNEVREMMTASLDVLSGIFRVTAQALSQVRGMNAARVRIATTSIVGIRG
jgi:hypothetical protein